VVVTVAAEFKIYCMQLVSNLKPSARKVTSSALGHNNTL
jgi:hypothetical protein